MSVRRRQLRAKRLTAAEAALPGRATCGWRSFESNVAISINRGSGWDAINSLAASRTKKLECSDSALTQSTRPVSTMPAKTVSSHSASVVSVVVRRTTCSVRTSWLSSGRHSL